MKTLAALGLLLLSGLLVVSGAMMGTLAAEQDVDAPVLGPCEIRVYVLGSDGQAWPRERVQEPSILVEPVTRAGPGDRAPAVGAPPAAGEKLSRQLDLEWVEPRDERRDGEGRSEKARPRGQERRNDAGYGARVVVLERKAPEADRRVSEEDGGGYWRAVYTPPADRRVAGFGATVIFKDRGTTRTIGGFEHPTAGTPPQSGGRPAK